MLKRQKMAINANYPGRIKSRQSTTRETALIPKRGSRFLFVLMILLQCVQSTAWQTKVPAINERGRSEMSLVPAVRTKMGIDSAEVAGFERLFEMEVPELFTDLQPKHEVTLKGFYIDKSLVTNARFRRFTDANPAWSAERISPALHNGHYLEGFERALATKPQHPVVNVSWYSAVAYCQWTGKRLPTEAEFEHAARGGKNAIFPWGSAPADRTHANYSASKIGDTTPVGSYPANGYGLFDMSGNVWEFMADEYVPYTATAQGTTARGDDGFASGDSFLSVKTRRAGAPINLWVEYRDSHPPANAKPYVGFRCASDR